MNRRTFVCALTCSAVALAGCSDDETDDQEPQDDEPASDDPDTTDRDDEIGNGDGPEDEDDEG